MSDVTEYVHKDQIKNDKMISLEAAQELIVAVMERQVKRLFILCLVIFIALVLSNAAWLYYESQFQEVVTETFSAQTDQGGTAIANGDGSITLNGESNLHKDN